jgi:hypothetical protein
LNHFLCIPLPLNRLLDDFANPPSFPSAQGSGAGDQYLVSCFAGIGFVMDGKLGPALYKLMVKLMFNQPLDQYSYRFVHFVTDDGAD